MNIPLHYRYPTALNTSRYFADKVVEQPPSGDKKQAAASDPATANDSKTSPNPAATATTAATVDAAKLKAAKSIKVKKINPVKLKLPDDSGNTPPANINEWYKAIGDKVKVSCMLLINNNDFSFCLFLLEKVIMK